MNQRIIGIPSNKYFYRYDLKLPDLNWNHEFKSIEKNYFDNKLGYKNQANLFFFAGSEQGANLLGKSAISKIEQKEYYITECFSVKKLNLINLSNAMNIYHILCVFKDLDIDILTNKFKMYVEIDDDSISTFKDLRDTFYKAEKEENTSVKRELIEKLTLKNACNYTDVGYFGQRLSDFQNGLELKKIIHSKYPKIDGYVWDEFKNRDSLSYCLFNSEKISTPMLIDSTPPPIENII